MHGGDFTFLGYREHLDDIEKKMCEWYGVKVRGRLTGRPGSPEEVTLLNRKIRWANGALEYEADDRHREVIMKDMGLQEGSNSVVGPSVHESGGDVAGEPMTAEEAREYRALTARANYLGTDRPDLQFATKEACRRMANPVDRDWARLKRLGRYLVGAPRLVWRFVEVDPEMAQRIDIYSDSDWAGDLDGRRSTTGGIMVIGGCAVKSWSSTQAGVALSSGGGRLCMPPPRPQRKA